jgi:hypothetical protein
MTVETDPMAEASRLNQPAHINSQLDFDLHGVVGIRLVDAAADDLAAMMVKLGPYQAVLDREPDITIRFQEDLSAPGLQYLGLCTASFTDDHFYLLDKRSGQISARIPFDKIGEPCELVYRSGLGSVPLLTDIVRYTFLQKGYVSLHAAAFLYDGVGILVAGWSKGGKTEALVSFANHGAHYVGDEWVLLSPDGQRMLGLPTPVTLWDWQLEQTAPFLAPALSGEKKTLFRTILFLEATYRRISRGKLRGFLPVKALGRLVPVLKTGLHVREMPHILFKDRFCPEGAAIDKLFLIVSHSEPGIVVASCASSEIAQRMANSNEYEESPFLQLYRAYRFAFPHRTNPYLEGAPELRRSLLSRALKDKEAYQVRHPYPVSFQELFDIMRPLCGRAS